MLGSVLHASSAALRAASALRLLLPMWSVVNIEGDHQSLIGLARGQKNLKLD